MRSVGILIACLAWSTGPVLAEICEDVAAAIRADRIQSLAIPAETVAPFASLGLEVAGWADAPAEPTALRRLDLGAGPVTVLTQRPGPLACPRLAIPGPSPVTFDGGDCAWTPRFARDGRAAVLWRASWPDDTLYRQRGDRLAPLCAIRRQVGAVTAREVCQAPACRDLLPLVPRVLGEPRAVLGGAPAAVSAPVPGHPRHGAFGPATAIILDLGGPVTLTRWREGPRDDLRFDFSRPVPGAGRLNADGARLYTNQESILPITLAGVDHLLVVEYDGPVSARAFRLTLHGFGDGALRRIGEVTVRAEEVVTVERLQAITPATSRP